MDLFEQALGDIHGGWVLDVATGRGDFVELLADRLDGYTHIVGVDINERMIANAFKNISQKRTHFVQMDAGRLGFADESFDTVSISASLHHLADASPVLVEIERVLRPGGRLVVAETAVQLRRAYHIRLPDAIIWATARVNDAQLVTRNTKDLKPEWDGIHAPYSV